MSAFGKQLSEEVICVFDGGGTKYDALDRMLEAIVATGVVTDPEAFQKALYERENIRSTGFRRVAIPHVRIDEILEPTMGVGISRAGIDFESLDNEPVNIIVLFAMPSGSDKEYLGWLAQVMMALRTEDFVEKLVSCKTPAEVVSVLESNE